MTLKGYKQGCTKKILEEAFEKGMTIQELVATGVKTYDALKAAEVRHGIRLKTTSGKPEWGSIKQLVMSCDAEKMTVGEAAVTFDTTIATIYSLSQRYNINFKKAGYGEMKRWKELAKPSGLIPKQPPMRTRPRSARNGDAG